MGAPRTCGFSAPKSEAVVTDRAARIQAQVLRRSSLTDGQPTKLVSLC
jgi:hypothetical protein